MYPSIHWMDLSFKHRIQYTHKQLQDSELNAIAYHPPLPTNPNGNQTKVNKHKLQKREMEMEIGNTQCAYYLPSLTYSSDPCITFRFITRF